MDARPCSPSRTPFNLTQSRFEDRSMHKDVKNADRSEEVYENKGHDDIMPEKNSDFVSENTNSERNFAGFAQNFAGFVAENRWNSVRAPQNLPRASHRSSPAFGCRYGGQAKRDTRKGAQIRQGLSGALLPRARLGSV